MAKIKIEKNIPIPTKRPKETVSGIIKSMKPGDSFRVTPKKSVSIISTAYQILGKGRVTVRKYKDGSKRVWRTK